MVVRTLPAALGPSPVSPPALPSPPWVTAHGSNYVVGMPASLVVLKSNVCVSWSQREWMQKSSDLTNWSDTQVVVRVSVEFPATEAGQFFRLQPRAVLYVGAGATLDSFTESDVHYETNIMLEIR
jgi:hypothetical protein